MNILVTGANGQLGSEIRELADRQHDFHFTFTDVETLNLIDRDAVVRFFTKASFDFIINCSAYTAVDKAETEPELARAINGDAVLLLAEIAKERSIRVIHISTDYVFDGSGNSPISETATASPISVYGETKLQGEQHLLRILPNAYIIRTAWVYSTFGKNFVKTILKLSQERSELGIVTDQIGSPTYAADLASCILTIIHSIAAGKTDAPGIYHYTNDGVASWYDFAFWVTKFANTPCRIKPIKSEEYKTTAARPLYSLLDKSKIKQTFGIEIPHWTNSLQKCIHLLNSRP